MESGDIDSLGDVVLFGVFWLKYCSCTLRSPFIAEYVCGISRLPRNNEAAKSVNTHRINGMDQSEYGAVAKQRERKTKIVWVLPKTYARMLYG